MALSDLKILQPNTTVQDLPDQPGERYDAQQLKERFDHFPELLRQKLNALIEELESGYPGAAEMQQLTAALDAYASHAQSMAGEQHLGHVRIDNRTIVQDGQGRIAASGSGLPVASRAEAVAGSDNALLMTPLRVREAFQEFAAAAPPLLQQQSAEALRITALASRAADGILARGVLAEDGCYLQLCNAAGQVISALQLPAAVTQLNWNSSGAVLGFVLGNEACFAAVNGLQLGAVSKQGTVAVRCLQPLLNGNFAALGTDGNLYFYRLQNGGVSSVSAAVTLPQMQQATQLVVLADGCIVAAEGRKLHLYRLSGESVTHLAAAELAADVTLLAACGTVLAAALGGAAPALQTVSITENGLQPGVTVASGSAVTAMDWRADAAYLLAGTAEAAQLYGWNGYQLRLLAEQPLSAAAAAVLCGEQLQVGVADGAGALICLQVREQDEKCRAQAVNGDFTAAAQGFYLLPNAACRIYLGGERRKGEYCLLAGDSSRFTVDGGAYPVQVEAGGAGLYLALFDGAAWQICPLYLPPAAETEVLAGADTPRALTPAAAKKLLLQQGRRAATVVVAAADSANPQAADFCCRGASDQLVLADAVAALPESGGRIMLLDGTYVFDTGGVALETVGNYQVYRLLQINKPNVSICGVGDATCIKLADAQLSAASHQLYMITANGSGFALQDLRIDGNKSGNTQGEVIGVLLSATAVASKIEGCTFNSFSMSGSNVVAPRALLRGSRFADSTYGVRVVSGRAVLSGNEFFGNITCDCYSFQSELQAVGNHHEGGLKGYYLVQNKYALLSNNYLMGCYAGFQIEASTDVMLLTNFIQRGRDGSDYGDSGYPIFISNSSTGAMLHNFTDGDTAYIDSSSRSGIICQRNNLSDWNIS